eukprot:5767526-Amphidinium_carterae.2
MGAPHSCAKILRATLWTLDEFSQEPFQSGRPKHRPACSTSTRKKVHSNPSLCSPILNPMSSSMSVSSGKDTSTIHLCRAPGNHCQSTPTSLCHVSCGICFQFYLRICAWRPLTLLIASPDDAFVLSP